MNQERVPNPPGFDARCGDLGVEALESRQLLSATVLGASAQATLPSVTREQVTSPIEPAVTPGVAPTVPRLDGGANSPPSASAPPTGSLNENSSLSFSTTNGDAISIADAAAGANGSSSLTESGTVTNLDSALERYEASISQRAPRTESKDRFSAGGSDRVPDAYSQLISRYFESLAKRNK